MLKKLYKILKLTLIIAMASGLAGVIGGLFVKWPIYKGLYIGILISGLITMLYSSANFIGLPKDRFEFFSGKTIKNEKAQSLGDKGWKPAFIGVILISLALFIEAIFHNL